MIRLIIYAPDGSGYDVTELTGEISCSGNYQSCARELSFDLLANTMDKDFPSAPYDIGDRVIFYVDGSNFFDGFIFGRSKSTGDSRISITCFDRGYYLKRNKGRYSFSGMTAEAIANRICGDFGIPVGSLAATGIPISRNFVNVELYKIIMSAYSLAAEQTGKKYQATFVGESLHVIEKKADENTLLLEAGSGLMNASCSESIEQMINQVLIYSSDGLLLQTIKDDEEISRYGVFQETAQQSAAGDDMSGKARKTLAEHGYTQKMAVENMGNIKCITGHTVAVREPYTGICGLFWIDSDIHTWKNGLYFNKLTVNFNCIMDEQEAGALPKAGSTTGADSASKNHYVNKPKTEESGQYGGGRRFSRYY